MAEKQNVPAWLERALDPSTPTTEANETVRTENNYFEDIGAEIIYPTIRMGDDGNLYRPEDPMYEAIKNNDFIVVEGPPTRETAEKAMQISKQISNQIQQARTPVDVTSRNIAAQEERMTSDTVSFAPGGLMKEKAEGIIAEEMPYAIKEGPLNRERALLLAQEQDPEGLASLQESNTEDKSDWLNIAQYYTDDYVEQSPPPIQKLDKFLLENAAYSINVPFGTEDSSTIKMKSRMGTSTESLRGLQTGKRSSEDLMIDLPGEDKNPFLVMHESGHAENPEEQPRGFLEQLTKTFDDTLLSLGQPVGKSGKPMEEAAVTSLDLYRALHRKDPIRIASAIEYLNNQYNKRTMSRKEDVPDFSTPEGLEVLAENAVAYTLSVVDQNNLYSDEEKKELELDIKNSFKENEDIIFGLTNAYRHYDKTGDLSKVNMYVNALEEQYYSPSKMSNGGLMAERQALEAQLESGEITSDEYDAQADQLSLRESFKLPKGDVRSDIFPIISRQDETAVGGKFLDIGTPGFVKDAIIRGGEIVADLRSGKTPDPQTVTETAMDIGTGGLGSSAVTSAGADIAGMGLGMFAKSTRKPRAHDKAIDLVAQGVDEDTVFRQTGVFPGPDGQLRFEIDDSKAKFEVNVGVIDTGFTKDAVKIAEIYPYSNNPDYKKDLVLGDILDHPELYKYYPEARNIPVSEIPALSGARGSFKPYDAKGNTEPTIALDSNIAYSMEKAKASDSKAKARGNSTKNQIFDELEEKKGVLLHEIQHYVQFVDELGAGGNSSLFLPDNFLDIERTLRERLKPLENKLDAAKKSSVMARLRLKDIYKGKENVDPKHIDAAKEVLTPEEFKEFETLVGMQTATDLMKDQAFEFYKRLGGEVEARFTQKRRDMSSASRAQARPDFSTVDSDAEKGFLSVGTAEDVFLDSPDRSKFSPEIQEFLGNAERYADKLSKYLGLDKKDIPDTKAAGLMADETSPVTSAINVRTDNKAGVDYAEEIISGNKKYETRDTPSLNSYVGKRIGIAKTGAGEAKAIGSVEIGEPIVVDEKQFREMQDLHLVPEGSAFDIKPGSKKYLYPVNNPERFDTPKSVGRGIVSRKIIDDASALKAVEPMEVGFNEALMEGKFLKNYDNTVASDMASKSKTATTGARGETDLLMAEVPEGTKVGVRLNLNSKIEGMPKGLDKLQTLHQGTYSGKALSYQPFVVVKNVKFNVSQPGRTGIAARIKGIDTPEAKNKFPAMSVDGEYVPKANLLSGNTDDLVEIGFNPAAHHLFIDLNTGQAVKGADEAMVIGDRVYARGVEYWKKSEAPTPKPTKSGEDIPSDVRFKEMNTGGLMLDEYNRAIV